MLLSKGTPASAHQKSWAHVLLGYICSGSALGPALWGWDSIMKTWPWLGLIPGQIPFLPHFSQFARWDMHGLFSIARHIFLSVHFHLSFCLFVCSGKVSPYLEHALNLHREPGAGGEGSVVLLVSLSEGGLLLVSLLLWMDGKQDCVKTHLQPEEIAFS